MTNHPAPAAVLVALLDAPEITAPCCELEPTVFALYRHDDNAQSKCLAVWARPDSFAAALKVKQVLAPGWVIDESWSESTMPSGA